MGRRGAGGAIWAASGALSALIVAPLWSGGYLLYRDAVSTPRGHVTDTALGLGDLPARAVPQDWAVAVLSHVVDGGLVVVALTTLALVLTGAGAGRLAQRLLPAAGTPGAIAAVAVAVWNPFVAERLLQGQWSLLLGLGALSWIALACLDCRETGGVASWLRLAGWCAAAALTPTGGLMAAVLVVAVVVVPTVARRRIRPTASAAAAVAVANLPWVTASILAGASTTSDPGAVAVFAARGEPGLGTLGSLAGLAGIWNADAVPGSRTIGWAGVATACLLLVVAVGIPVLWRRRRTPLIVELSVVAVVTLVLCALAATGPGRSALGGVVDVVPGAGLLRDTGKFVALAVPVYAVAAAAAVQLVGRWIPRGAAAGVAVLLVVAPLPDLAWGVGGAVRTVDYPQDWRVVAEEIPAGSGDVVTVPAGTNRRYAFTGGAVSLDPAARLLRVPVLAGGSLIVDGRTVDAPDPGSRAALADRVVADGGTAADLARLGVGWVLVEEPAQAARCGAVTVSGLRCVHDGVDLALLRVPDPIVVRASTVSRSLSWAAHLVWVATIAAGIAAGARRRLVQWRDARR
ncbi:hypothetical protein [Williamsia deligens]|uniref:Transmembrane protein n=1 Tax=Williamsia deligens TaxID=321325 RepID=A0ABW3G3Q3_9NOCA|nr:hypothetical protein [Williamsia deligens]MCP2194062.1 hypothetical protein [Williamsia deligens]